VSSVFSLLPATHPRLYGATLSGIVMLESSKTADLVPAAFMHYAEHALSILDAFVPFSPSIRNSCEMLRGEDISGQSVERA
jgi:hypothetical protein